jgi:hypothetical protein
MGPAANPVESRLDYRRLATAAEAIRFVVKDFPALRTLGGGCKSEASGYLRPPKLSNPSSTRSSAHLARSSAGSPATCPLETLSGYVHKWP